MTEIANLIEEANEQAKPLIEEILKVLDGATGMAVVQTLAYVIADTANVLDIPFPKERILQMINDHAHEYLKVMKHG